MLRNVAPDLGDPVESREEQPDERRPVTLPYRQERLVRRADRELCRSDPDLASMLSIFALLAGAEQMPAWEQLRPGLTGTWRVLLWPAAALTFLVVFAAGGGSRAAAAYAAYWTAGRGWLWLVLRSSRSGPRSAAATGQSAG